MGLSSHALNAFIAVTDMTRAEEFYEGKLVVDELTSNGVTFEQYEGVLESAADQAPALGGDHDRR